MSLNDDIAELRRTFVGHHNRHIGQKNRERLARVLAEVERLRAVVDRLPQTDDGVPVLPGDVVWTVFADSADDGPEPVTIEYLRPGGTYKACYSTREAAGRAGGEG